MGLGAGLKSTPRVYIVGAGPGDPDLISVRGLRCLGRADVVVHDHRVHPDILAQAPAGAERIDVGAPAPRPLDQDAISYLVAEKAREGKVVVRLKWGDPFVFDSGGKEAIFLHEQQIRFEVVPGIPLAIGGSAYAGVPITYPEAGDAVVLIRGNEAETDAPAVVDWAGLAGVGGTIVCYAGARQIDSIARALVAHGRSPVDAAVLVYDATLPVQRTVQGAIGDIALHALPDRPALLVIGPVAGLREHLRWFDTRPLFGRRILVTRAREQAADLIALLRDRGAETIGVPTIRIVPPEDGAPLDAACDTAERYDWIVFTSVNGVEHFMRRFLERRDIRDLKDVRLCTVGPATAAALAQYGVRVDLTPAEHRAEGLVEAFAAFGKMYGMRVLLPRAEMARELVGEELRAMGAEVMDVEVYRTLPAGEGSGPDVYGMLLDGRIDAVTFTSASTVRNFVRLLGEEQAPDLLRSTVVATIGPVTAEAARQLGIEPAIVPSEYTVAALVDALTDYFVEHPQSATVAR
jgi:uroporphyrinogen III methyltransferase/synthase